jgi:hypothetical protein
VDKGVAVAVAAVVGGGIRQIGDAPLHVAIGGGLAGALYVGSIVFTVRAFAKIAGIVLLAVGTWLVIRE